MAHLEREDAQLDRRNEYMFTLYVSNLPEELNTDGIAQIFQSFGEIRIISPSGAQWAFVSYKTYSEAEHAIRALNDRSPLYLKVAFQRKKHQKESQNYDSHVGPGPVADNFAKDFRYAENRIATNGNCSNFMPAMLGANLNQLVSYNREQNVNSVYPSDLDHNMYNPYETVDRYADTNAMWSRGTICVDPFGKRHVSMGRGFTRYHIPDPHPNLERQIGAVYEKRVAGLYEYGRDRSSSGVGKCQFCTRVASQYCEHCGGFYCSKECQVDDWPRHKTECLISMPAYRNLVQNLEVVSLSRSSSDDLPRIPRTPGGMDLRALGVLRRPRKAATLNAKSPIPEIRSTNNNEPVEEVSINLVAAPLGEVAKPSITIDEKSTNVDSFPAAHQKNHQTPLQHVDRNENSRNTSNNSESSHDNRNDDNEKIVNRRYDENSNDRSNTNPATHRSNSRNNLQNGFRNDRSRSNQNKENNRPYNRGNGNFRSTPGGQNPSTIANQGQNNVAGPSEKMSERARADLMKMDDDLAFRREPREITTLKKNQEFTSTPSTSQSEPQMSVAESTETISSLNIDKTMSKTDFTDVIVVHKMSDGTFWVQRQSDSLAVYEMMTELQKKMSNSAIVKNVNPGEMYGYVYDDLWHRVQIVTKNPLNIFFVDFGNHEIARADHEFRDIGDFTKYPPFAMRMRFSVMSKLKDIGDVSELSVRVIGVLDNGVAEVVNDPKKSLNDNEPTPIGKIVLTDSVGKTEMNKLEVSTRSVAGVAQEAKTTIEDDKKVDAESTDKLPSTLDTLETSSSAWIQVLLALDDNSYAISAISPGLMEQYDMVYEILTQTCDAIAKPTNFKPQVGDFVCGKRNEVWVRGHVYSVGPPMRLALIDEARISVVQEVMPMPQKFANICSFGCICKFANGADGFGKVEAAEFKVTGIDVSDGEKIVRAVLVNPEELRDVKVTLRNWSPTREQKGIDYADLKTNSKVFITAFNSERMMFVRSLDDESVEHCGVLTQKIAKWAQKAPKLDGPPANGQLVIAKFQDGNFYRAVVTKLQDRKVTVAYIDYGNRETTTIDDLRLLSDELKNERSCVAKIVLKDITTDVPPTQDVHRYLNRLVSEEQPLVCTFEGIPSKDGVILTTESGESVNDKVNEYLVPGWKRKDPAEDTKCYTMTQLDFAKLGEVGQTTQAIVLYGCPVPLAYNMCPIDVEHLTHVSEVLPPMIEEYCTSKKVHYIPRISELCLAVYDNVWYRGLCLNPSATPTQAEIHFIDYGNVEVVDHVNIREMAKDFMSPAALACLCEVKNLGIELTNGDIPANVKARLDSLIPVNGQLEIKITKKMEEGYYEIELPQVRQKLVEEGLVKSI